MHKVAVVGASGYTGGELLRLISGHPDLDLALATANSNVGKSIAEVFPSLAIRYEGQRFSAYSADALNGLDVVFLALPHGESQKIVPEVIDKVGHVIDLGADFRLSAEEYKRWYGEDHLASSYLDQFQFGLVELYRDQIKSAQHIANPGCYPTTVSLSLAPLFANQIAQTKDVIADCSSGTSGAGRSLKADYLFSEVGEGMSAYGLLNHRHTAEMELALTNQAGQNVQVLFTPHLAPMIRGIIATCYVKPIGTDLSTETLLTQYREFYKNETFVCVTDEPSGTKATYGSNAFHVTVRYDERTNTIVTVGVLDNLVKGASGQAVQNTNLLLGLDETSGLTTEGITP